MVFWKSMKICFGHFWLFFNSIWYFWLWNINIQIQRNIFLQRNILEASFGLQSPILNSHFSVRSAGISHSHSTSRFSFFLRNLANFPTPPPESFFWRSYWRGFSIVFCAYLQPTWRQHGPNLSRSCSQLLGGPWRQVGKKMILYGFMWFYIVFYMILYSFLHGFIWFYMIWYGFYLILFGFDMIFILIIITSITIITLTIITINNTIFYRKKSTNENRS